MINDDIDVDSFTLRVARVRRNGTRDYDPVSKRCLVELCLRPGASVAGIVLKAQANANQLRKWMRLHRESKAAEHVSLAVFLQIVQEPRSHEVETVFVAPRRTKAVAVEPRPQPSRPVALSPRAQGYALGVLNNLYRFLVDQNYLMGNPWHGIHVPREARPALDVGRSLTEDQWAFVLAQLDALPPASARQRLQVVLPLLYATGLRLSEVVAATTAHLAWVSLPQPGTRARIEGWWLEVVGKGNKLLRVPVLPAVIARLGAYLVARGHPTDPGASRVPGGVALLGHATDLGERAPWAGACAANPVDAAAGIGPVILSKQIKGFFAACVGTLCLADQRGAAGGRQYALAAALPTRDMTTEDGWHMVAMKHLLRWRGAG